MPIKKGDFVLIRTYSAGVHFGFFEEKRILELGESHNHAHVITGDIEISFRKRLA